MTGFVIDIEADGPYCPRYSMISFGAVVLDEYLQRTFYGQLRPISDQWVPEALAVSGHTREETLAFPLPQEVMERFVAWVQHHNASGTRPQFFSDNNGFDAGAFMNYYLWEYTGGNIFGHTSRNINDLYHGLKRSMRCNIRRLKKTPHTHHPVDDAKGNAEALLAMRELGLDLVL